MNGAPSDASAPPAQPQKFQRYRSVRKINPAVKDVENGSPLPPLPTKSQTSLMRLPSRYHRREQPTDERPPPPAFAPAHSMPAAQPQLTSLKIETPQARNPELGESTHDNARETKITENTSRRVIIQHGHRSSNPKAGAGRDTSHQPPLDQETPRPKEHRRSYDAAREEARMILEGEVDRLKTLRRQEAKRQQENREKREKKEEQRLAEETVRRETEARAKEEKRIKETQEKPGAQVANPQASTRSRAAQEAVSDLKKPSRTLVIGGPRSPKDDKPKHHQRNSLPSEEQRRPEQSYTTPTRGGRVENPVTTSPPSKPNFDAPVSAVNAGERRVGVRCRNTRITMPVTLSTTCKDILSSAATCMSELIDPRTAVLVESFSQLGLERPLRRYERIRDVMNSWDNDEQNDFLIMTSGECAATGLQVTEAPRQQPSGTVVQIYHSQRPGKWDKRWIRLREDGQVSTSKHEHGLDSTKICHVSDFDVYTPTTKQMRKLKLPRKMCFALKSQEKSAVFLSGANFVHFFCTKDKDVAEKWYQAVHSWRSWYLVNMLGEGQQTVAEPTLTQQSAGSRPGTQSSKGSGPYVLGSFKPLLDFGSSRPSMEGGRPSHGDTARPLVDFATSERPNTGSDSPSPKRPWRSGGGPPSAYPRKFMLESPSAAAGQSPGSTANDASDSSNLSPFSSTGLIARSASRRSQAGASHRSGGGRSAPSVDGKPKPLLDLTPTSEFTNGSLLQKMEAMNPGPLEPKIDRQKRREIDVSVGEGFG